MLKRLKVKFILIVMTLVGLVLASVLAFSLFSSYAAQQRLIDESLARGVAGSLNDIPVIGGAGSSEAEGLSSSSMLMLALDISPDGTILARSSSPVTISSDTLGEVLDDIQLRDSRKGRLPERHVAWMSGEGGDAGTRIVIVDTRGSDAAMYSQLVQAAAIMLVGLFALFGITVFLSDWALRPVARAWDQQRRFIADASHELKTPLSVIIANTEILASSRSLSAEDREWVRRTASESRHMKALVADLLQLARTDDAEAQGYAAATNRAAIDLSEMASSAALEFEPLAFEKGCSIEMRVQDGVSMQGDREWVDRMIRILLDNACKYASPDSKITLGLTEQGQHRILSVNNMGNPIEAKDLAHVFERFYRSDKARARGEGAGGFGLGLAIAKGVAEAHGGSISVTSGRREGTTFTVQL